MQLPASSSSKKLEEMTLHMEPREYRVLSPVTECKQHPGEMAVLCKTQAPFSKKRSPYQIVQILLKQSPFIKCHMAILDDSKLLLFCCQVCSRTVFDGVALSTMIAGYIKAYQCP